MPQKKNNNNIFHCFAVLLIITVALGVAAIATKNTAAIVLLFAETLLAIAMVIVLAFPNE